MAAYRWHLLFVLSLAGVAGCVAAFGWRGNQLAAYGVTVAIPDTTQGMTPAYLHYFGWQLGEAGRQFYIWTQLSLDSLFPLVYVTWLVSMAKLAATGAMQKLLVRGALIAGAFDLSENLLLCIALALYPNWTVLAWPITAFTSLKLVGLVLTFAVCAPLFVIHLVEWIVRKIKGLPS